MLPTQEKKERVGMTRMKPDINQEQHLKDLKINIF